jgi:hypothetical protein
VVALALKPRKFPVGSLMAVNWLSGIPGDGPRATIGTPTLILMHDRQSAPLAASA